MEPLYKDLVREDLLRKRPEKTVCYSPDLDTPCIETRKAVRLPLSVLVCKHRSDQASKEFSACNPEFIRSPHVLVRQYKSIAGPRGEAAVHPISKVSRLVTPFQMGTLLHETMPSCILLDTSLRHLPTLVPVAFANSYALSGFVPQDAETNRTLLACYLARFLCAQSPMALIAVF